MVWYGFIMVWYDLVWYLTDRWYGMDAIMVWYDYGMVWNHGMVWYEWYNVWYDYEWYTTCGMV